jgi:multimeric flavodoxin WrbA
MSKTVAILGSPRKHGNSTALASLITDRLTVAGSEVRTHHLNTLSYKGCQACGACKLRSEICVLDDDLRQVLADFSRADIVILATPVYWGEVSAQLKGFIDRIYSFLTPDFMTSTKKHRLAGAKKLVFIQTQGADSEEFFGDIFPRYNGFFSQLQLFAEATLIRGCGLNTPDAALLRPDLIQQAEAVVARLLESNNEL